MALLARAEQPSLAQQHFREYLVSSRPDRVNYLNQDYKMLYFIMLCQFHRSGPED